MAKSNKPVSATGKVAPASILDAMLSPALFAPWFRDPATWVAWFVFLKVLFGLDLDEAGRELFERCTGRKTPRAGGYTEAWLVCGRRAGKSLILALVACFLAYFRDWSPYLAPGERGTIMILAADKRQARTIFRYARAFLRVLPAPEGHKTLIERETQDAIDLSNNITLEILTASYRGVRGYTLIASLCDEIAFWHSDEGAANPDTEILAALRPAMATVPGAVLLCASSPYSKRGALYRTYAKHHGKDDSAILTWQAPTKVMNPTISDEVIADAFEEDAVAAETEYNAAFRNDIDAFLDRELIESAIDTGITVRPPFRSVRYQAFDDPSGGRGDSFAVAIGHAEGDVAVLDCLYERKSPFNPSEVVSEVAALLRSYGVAEVVGDRYGASWVSEQFAKCGIGYRPSDRDRSALYLDALPLFSSGRVRLLDNGRLVNQLASLERRTSRIGRDRVDHPPGGADDLANAVAGVLTLVATNDGPLSGLLKRALRSDIAPLFPEEFYQ